MRSALVSIEEKEKKRTKKDKKSSPQIFLLLPPPPLSLLSFIFSAPFESCLSNVLFAKLKIEEKNKKKDKKR